MADVLAAAVADRQRRARPSRSRSRSTCTASARRCGSNRASAPRRPDGRPPHRQAAQPRPGRLRGRDRRRAGRARSPNGSAPTRSPRRPGRLRRRGHRRSATTCSTTPTSRRSAELARSPRCWRSATGCGRCSPRSRWWPGCTRRRPGSRPRRRSSPTPSARRCGASRAAAGRRPTCRCSTRPPNCSTATEPRRRRGGDRRAGAAGADGVRRGRAGDPARLPVARRRGRPGGTCWPATCSTPACSASGSASTDAPDRGPAGGRRPHAGRSGTSSSTRRRSSRRWPGGC